MLPSLSNATTLQWLNDLLLDFPEAKAYVVGGAVRDALRGVAIKDFDVLVARVPTHEIETWLASHGKVALQGSRFGIFGFTPYANPTNPRVEVAIPRSEKSEGVPGGYKNFAVQSDPYLSIEKDLARRDFTINAIAYDWKDGVLIDPFDGRTDLRAGVIKAVGNPKERLREDYTRILRAIRFAATLPATVEPKTWNVILEATPHLLDTDMGGHPLVAAEIIGQELLRTFMGNPRRAFDLFHLARLDRILWDNIDLTIPASAEKNPTLLFAILGEKTSPDLYDAWLKRWRMAVDRSAIRACLLFASGAANTISAAKVERMFLPHREILVPFLQKTKNVPAGKRLLSIFQASSIPPILTGDDLVAQGFSPSPLFGKILDAVRSAQLEERPIPPLRELLAEESEAMKATGRSSQAPSPRPHQPKNSS